LALVGTDISTRDYWYLDTTCINKYYLVYTWYMPISASEG